MSRKIMTSDNINDAIEMRGGGASWQDIGNRFGCHPQTVQRACLAVGKTDLRARTILETAADAAVRAGSFKAKKSAARTRKARKSIIRNVQTFPETRDNELMGTPPLSRSALNEVETDGRGNIAKRGPVRVSIGAINIPDIRIGAGHHA